MNTPPDPIDVFESVLKTLASGDSLNKKIGAFVVLLNLEIPITLCCTDRFEKVYGEADNLVKSFLDKDPGLGPAIVATILQKMYTWKNAKKRAAGAIDYIDLTTGEVSVNLGRVQKGKSQAKRIECVKELQKAKPDSRKRPSYTSTSAKKFRKKDQKVPKQQDKRKSDRATSSLQSEGNSDVVVIFEGAGNAREQLRNKLNSRQLRDYSLESIRVEDAIQKEHTDHIAPVPFREFQQQNEAESDNVHVRSVPSLPKSPVIEKEMNIAQMVPMNTPKTTPDMITFPTVPPPSVPTVHYTLNDLLIPGLPGPREWPIETRFHNSNSNKKMPPVHQTHLPFSSFATPKPLLPAPPQTDSFITPKPVTSAAPQTEDSLDEDEAVLGTFLDGSYSRKFDSEYGFPGMESVFESPASSAEENQKPNSENNRFSMNLSVSGLQTPPHMFDYSEPEYRPVMPIAIDFELNPVARPPNQESEATFIVPVSQEKTQSREKDIGSVTTITGEQVLPNKKSCPLIPDKLIKPAPTGEESRPVGNPVPVTLKDVHDQKPTDGSYRKPQPKKTPAPHRDVVAQKDIPISEVPPVSNQLTYSDGSMDMPDFDALLARNNEDQQRGSSNASDQAVYPDGSTDMPDFDSLITPRHQPAPQANPTVYPDGSMDMPDI